MSQLEHKNFTSPQDVLNAGWVLLRFDLDTLMWIGRDLEGNRWEWEPGPIVNVFLEPYIAFLSGLTLLRISPDHLKDQGATMIPRGNVADNRR